jgi:tricarballylate dehydrogenase
MRTRRPSSSVSPGAAGTALAGAPAGADAWDVVVIGGGNAALVSAISATEQGASVLLLERAPIAMRGGNSRHTRNVRCVHRHADAYNPGSYTYEELLSDLNGVGDGPSDPDLASLTIRESETVPQWMTDRGIRWQSALRGTLQLGRTNRFFLGGGKALVNSYYRTFAAMGGTVRYDTTVTGLVVRDDRCTGVVTDGGQIRCRAVVCAAGGYEANFEWLRRYWGEGADNYIIRGPVYNDGTVLQVLFDLDAVSRGQERGFHAIAVDARSPRYDGGIATRLDTIPFGIVVNRDGERFYDEGEDVWPKRYASWGRHIAEQPGQIAYSIWDERVNHRFLPTLYQPVAADTIAGLAQKLGLDPDAVEKTVAGYNAGVSTGTTFDPTRLDDCTTTGVTPPKTHWAQPIDRPPFHGTAMRPGITFTFRGVAVTPEARVRRNSGPPLSNVFAAGEIMSGNILSSGYLAGFGMTIGTVWGRIAGSEAGRVGTA